MSITTLPKLNLRKATGCILGLAAALVVSGCNNNTYGTGVSQSTQLVSDISNIAKLTPNKKKISYSARPGLVEVAKTDTLPAPAESVSSNSGYFPENPEERRRRLRAEAQNSDGSITETASLSPELQQLRRESAERSSRSKRKISDFEEQSGFTPLSELENRRKAYIAKNGTTKEQKSLKVRRYLTQPPTEYVQPAETAPIGVLGEKEGDPAKKKEKSLFSRVFGKK